MAPDAGRRRLATTRWSVVLAAGGADSPTSRAALETLCEAYWYPVYAFVRRAGHSSEDARDLTQEFFSRVLDKGYLRAVRPERGRFRGFLLTSVRHFLSNERDWQTALKRGGGTPILPLEFDDGERRYQIEPSDDWTPDRIYEHRWATTVLEVAMRRFDETQARHGRKALFNRLRGAVFADGDAVKYGDLAAELGMSEGALRIAVHRLRRQFGAVLREVIAETVERDDAVDEELRYLLEIVSNPRPLP